MKFLKRFIILNDVFVWEYVHVSMGAGRGQGRTSDLLERKLQAGRSFLIRVLGTELWSCTRTILVLVALSHLSPFMS